MIYFPFTYLNDLIFIFIKLKWAWEIVQCSGPTFGLRIASLHTTTNPLDRLPHASSVTFSPLFSIFRVTIRQNLRRRVQRKHSRPALCFGERWEGRWDADGERDGERGGEVSVGVFPPRCAGGRVSCTPLTNGSTSDTAPPSQTVGNRRPTRADRNWARWWLSPFPAANGSLSSMLLLVACYSSAAADGATKIQSGRTQRRRCCGHSLSDFFLIFILI